MLRSRLLVAAAAIPLVLVLDYLGGWPLALLVGALAVAGALELLRIGEAAGLRACRPLALAATPLLVLAGHLGPAAGLVVPVAAGLVVLGLLWAILQPVEPSQAVAGWAATVALPLYLGLPLGLALALRGRAGPPTALVLGPLGELELARGALWLGLALGLGWAGDTAAYAVGRLFGRRPFFQRISPRKTAEGTAAGVAAAALLGLLGGPLVGLGPLAGLLLGGLAGLAAVFGDLAESLLKRAGGVKNSGALFPGHGGVLDRVDSLLFVFVVVYYLGGVAA